MARRNRAGQILVTAGSIGLGCAAALHLGAGYRNGFPALAASNLGAGLQSGFRVVFLSVAWDWILIALIAVVAAFRTSAGGRVLVLVCGFGVLIESIAGAAAMGLFFGNELIGAAAILTVIGGLLLGDANG